MNKIRTFYQSHPTITLIIISAFLGFLTALFADQIASIIYNFHPSYKYINDQGMFYYMGVLLAQGKTPYIDFFDHKGPYIFYYTGLGVLLGGRIGMMIVQTITFGFFYYFAIKSMKLYDTKTGVMAILILIVFAVIVFSGQSPSDFEIDYPFIMASIYFYLKAIKEDVDKYFLYGNILTGITAGISIHLRATDAMISLAMVIYFGVRQIVRKRYKNLLINAGVCLGGVIFASLPPLIHSISGGFTSLMYEACIINNFKYVSTASQEEMSYRISSRLIIAGLSIIIATLIASETHKKKFENGEPLFYAIVLGIVMLIQFIIAIYPHYLLITPPILCIFFARILNINNIKKPVLITLECLAASIALAGCLVFPINNYVNQAPIDAKINEFISATISEEDRNGKVICYQTSSSYYLNNNITVSYGDFAVQTNHMKLSKDFSFEKFKEYITGPNCKYVIYSTTWEKSWPEDEFISWLTNESGLNQVISDMPGSEYIKIYQK